MITLLLVASPCRIVLVDATPPGLRVVGGKEGHHHQPLHRHGKGLPNHLSQLVGLSGRREHHSLKLLVMFDFDAEKPGHLKRRTGRAGDGHTG